MESENVKKNSKDVSTKSRLKLMSNNLMVNIFDLVVYYPNCFDEWWDPDKFDWNKGYVLASYCSQHFDTWWDPEKYNWEKYSWALIKYCFDKFDIWWDPERFNWKKDSYSLAKFGFIEFHKWWDPDRFNWSEFNTDNLINHCLDYIHVWLPELIVRYPKQAKNILNDPMIINKLSKDKYVDLKLRLSSL